MTYLATLLILQAQVIVKPDEFLTHSRSAVGSGVRSRVEELFQRKEDGGYLFEMASRRGGLRGIKVAMIPAPPGWEDTAPFWAVFSSQQEIEQDHDPVYPVLRTDRGLRLGKELPEWAGHETRIANLSVSAQLLPRESRTVIHAIVDLEPKRTTRAVIFRLNNNYAPSEVRFGDRESKVVDGDTTLPTPSEGDTVRVGSLLIPWTKTPEKRLHFRYGGVVNTPNQDKINEKQAYLTAWWVPSIGRLPHPTTVRVTGPKTWVLKSEGKEIPTSEDGFGPATTSEGNQTLSFRCDLPISYPKIVGGLYKLAAEETVDGKQFRSYQLEPVEVERGKQEIKKMAEAMKFFENALGPFPFDHYWCFDATGYYGIESYSHTLLQKGFTLRFVSHEMGHTYFGGVVPCAYVRDTWNEGVTQYFDSVVFQNNNDRTLESGLRTVGIDVPLTQMNVAYANGGASYWRGAYVMKMLEAEIGKPQVLEALRAMVKDRVGKDTAWPDLRPYFEKASGQKLDWYWKQWISNSKFPSVEVTDAEPIKIEKKWRTRVTIKQSGTADPFRLRFLVRVRRGPQTAEQTVLMTSPQATYSVESAFEPTAAEVEVFPYALARVIKK